jgi:TolB-like protein
MKTLIFILGVLSVRGGLAATVQEAVRYDSGKVRGAFLALGPGARPVGLGEAFTAIADDATAASWNPGGLAQLDSFSAVAMHDLRGQGMGLSHVSVAVPAGPGVIGAGITALSFGGYDLRDDLGRKTGTDSVTDLAGSVAWGFANPEWMEVSGWTGLSFEAVREAAGKTLIGASVGWLVPLSGSFKAGLSFQHLGPPSDGFYLPAAAKLGGVFSAGEILRLSADVGYPLVDKDIWAAAGCEYAPVRLFAVRAGYKWQAGETGISGLTGLAVGVGFRLASFVVDYAYQPFGDLAVSHRLSLTYASAKGRQGEVARAASAPEAALLPPPPVPEPPLAEIPLVPREKVNVAVLQFEAQNTSSGDAAVVADWVRNELVRSGRCTVLERVQVEKVMAEHALQTTGCTTEECAVKLGRLLNVQRMVVGSFGKLLSSYVISVRVVDVETGSIVYGDTVKTETEKGMEGDIKALVARLAGSI